MQILHKAGFSSDYRHVMQTLQRCNRTAGRLLRFLRKRMALILRMCCVMKTYAHDTVQRLLDLQSLEERLAESQRSHEKSADVQALIESLRANLPVSVLINHDRMRKRGKVSVASVRNGVCSACHLALALGNVAALRRGDMRQCGNCGRYLYLVEGEQEQQTSLAPAAKGKTTKGKSPVTSDAN